mmetsp:Transcript_48851/g.156485  ORF Transcript_48851/g.156485 Transcript_48851/m.156485 type:complete len:258 (-) Transcript_48851:908-1681(-)
MKSRSGGAEKSPPLPRPIAGSMLLPDCRAGSSEGGLSTPPNGIGAGAAGGGDPPRIAASWDWRAANSRSKSPPPGLSSSSGSSASQSGFCGDRPAPSAGAGEEPTAAKSPAPPPGARCLVGEGLRAGGWRRKPVVGCSRSSSVAAAALGPRRGPGPCPSGATRGASPLPEREGECPREPGAFTSGSGARAGAAAGAAGWAGGLAGDGPFAGAAGAGATAKAAASSSSEKSSSSPKLRRAAWAALPLPDEAGPADAPS